MLTDIPTSEEIKKVVFSFEGSKALGPNGFPLLFFQWFWDIVGEDVEKAVKDFFCSRNILKELNATFLVLIPKKTWSARF